MKVDDVAERQFHFTVDVSFDLFPWIASLTSMSSIEPALPVLGSA
jgi:hypothetical protein